ncbi:unnamed protein product, partial [Discosporangium mesarthrocarpum]
MATNSPWPEENDRAQRRVGRAEVTGERNQDGLQTDLGGENVESVSGGLVDRRHAPEEEAAAAEEGKLAPHGGASGYLPGDGSKGEGSGAAATGNGEGVVAGAGPEAG